MAFGSAFTPASMLERTPAILNAAVSAFLRGPRDSNAHCIDLKSIASYRLGYVHAVRRAESTRKPKF